MIVYHCEQGSEEWHRHRCGIPTASKFDKILTPNTMQLSASSKGYLCELIAEWVNGGPIDAYQSQFMTRGTALEGDGRKWYEKQYRAEVEQVGFVMRDDWAAGCSPDGLVGDVGMLEVKAPAIATHVKYLLDPSRLVADYRTQLMGNLWLAEREWIDIVSYSPVLHPVPMRVERDDAYISALASAIDQFVEWLERERHKVLSQGYTPATQKKDEEYAISYYGA